MKILIILLLFLSGCPPITRTLDDCINDRTGEFDISDCFFVYFDDICKDIDGFCTHFKKNNSNSRCLKQITEKCEEHKERMNNICKDIEEFCNDKDDKCLERNTKNCKEYKK